MAERSKVPDSRSGPHMRAWVQIPFLTYLFIATLFIRAYIHTQEYDAYEQTKLTLHMHAYKLLQLHLIFLEYQSGWPSGLRCQT